MGKRKQTVPQHADLAKRQQLRWNMTEQFVRPGSDSFICDGALKYDHLNRSESSPSPPSLAATSSTESSLACTPVHALCVDAFYQNLASCHSTLTLHNPDYVKTKEKLQLLEFCHFNVTLKAHPKLTPLPDQLPEYKECWLYLADNDNPSMLYFEAEDNNENIIQHKKPTSRQTKFGVFWFVSLNVPVAVLAGLKSKLFLLLTSGFDINGKNFTVTVFGKEALVLQLSHPSEPIRIKMPQLAVQKLMEFYYDIMPPYNFEGLERTTGHNFFHLYESVMCIQLERVSNDQSWLSEVDSIHHDCLKPVLRQYQKQSVAWMLRQEKRPEAEKGKDELHPLYCEVNLRGTTLYYNRYAGSLIRNRTKAIPMLPGGILADEMGLGKTVEVLCCMLLHPRSDVELPEQLPVIEDFLLESSENSESVSSNDSPISDKLVTEKSPKMKEIDADSFTVRESNSKCSSTGAEVMDLDHMIKTVTNAAVHEGTGHVLDACVIPSASLKLDSINDNSLLYANSEATITEKLPSMDAYSVSLLPGARDSIAPEEITFLSSKETVDLTDDLDSESLEFSTSAHSITHLSNGTVDMSLEPNTMKGADSIGIESADNKVVIKIISNNERPLFVAESSNFNTVTSETASVLQMQNHIYDSLLANSQNKSNALSGNTSHNLAAPLPTTQSVVNINVERDPLHRKKGKRKSRGYVEYIPITDEDTSYFSSKPTAQKQYFECNCGQLDDEEETRRKGLNTVKCNLCGMSQHAECMNYDLKDPFRGNYYCPHCHALSTTIKSGATLIISPYSICHQWIEEISKHIKERSIKVFIYTGVSKLGYIQPQTLAQQDIVITTYDVLRKEVDYVNLPHTNSESGRRFRHPKRFLATPSPMVAVEWWRICLDEAQMVECVTTKTAEMALKLKAVNRWCVTGTPLMRSVEDIYGLLLFLGVDPLLVQQWFRLLVWEPFCHGFTAPMHYALSQVLWRTAKKDVIDQIDLPHQTEEVNWLTFSPVEEHFYRRQYELYLRSAYTNRKKASSSLDPSTKLHALDRKTMSELLSPLFRLRQACCHPQIVRGEFLPLNKSMMTMEELLEHMTKKVKTECEEAHRQIVASLNGMAGLAILRGKIADAVDKYRDVLRSVEEHTDQFRTDELQQLHAMYNLAELLDQQPAGVSPTLRDSSLREQCEELKRKYMIRTKTNVAGSKEALEATQISIKDLSRKLSALDGDWWADVIDLTVQRGIDGDLIYKIKDDLMRTSTTEGTIVDIFTNANGLMYVVDSHLQTLAKARQNLTTQLDSLAKDTSPALVQKAAMCCLRPVSEILKTCPFCKVDELFNEYESKLFLFVERGVTVAGDDSNLAYQVSTRRQGTWADSEVEKAIKSILAFYRLHFDADHDVLEAASLHLKYMDTLKKEFRNLRSLWLSHRELVSAIDELEMATERLRLRKDFEPESATKILNIIEEKEMSQQELKCSSDEIIGRDELRKKLGQLVYLTNLAKKNQNGQDSNPDVCPICQSGLGVEWSVLMCGHCYCLSCIRALIDRNLIGGHLIDRRLKCPVCRHMTPVREISYVTTLKTEKLDVKGSHSTKVQAVIQCLIKIRQQDPTAKSLVFSVWVSVLDILAAALTENKISYKSLHDPNYFQKNLTSFKSDESIQVLLLPLHTGANGLNLVEANHVLLVEPELNLEEEAQAISRIYRIGQTRQTKIHRFLVRGTIEEKIFHMVKALRESKRGQEQVGESLELTVGHITSLLQQPGPADEDEDEFVVNGDAGAGVDNSNINQNYAVSRQHTDNHLATGTNSSGNSSDMAPGPSHNQLDNTGAVHSPGCRTIPSNSQGPVCSTGPINSQDLDYSKGPSNSQCSDCSTGPSNSSGPCIAGASINSDTKRSSSTSFNGCSAGSNNITADNSITPGASEAHGNHNSCGVASRNGALTECTKSTPTSDEDASNSTITTVTNNVNPCHEYRSMSTYCSNSGTVPELNIRFGVSTFQVPSGNEMAGPAESYVTTCYEKAESDQAYPAHSCPTVDSDLVCLAIDSDAACPAVDTDPACPAYHSEFQQAHSHLSNVEPSINWAGSEMVLSPRTKAEERIPPFEQVSLDPGNRGDENNSSGNRLTLEDDTSTANIHA